MWVWVRLPSIEAKFSSRISSYEPNRIRLLVAADKKGLLTIGETFYPGWKAFLNGTESPILRANGMLRGVILPPGKHEVRLRRTNPLSYRLGAAVSLGSLLLALLLLALPQ
jgi:uncharacterized membrane protein YfhO